MSAYRKAGCQSTVGAALVAALTPEWQNNHVKNIINIINTINILGLINSLK
jgi:hypothetical protein